MKDVNNTLTSPPLEIFQRHHAVRACQLPLAYEMKGIMAAGMEGDLSISVTRMLR